MKQLFFLLFFGLCLTSTGFGQQKYGHINLGNLILAMPETEKANADLEAYQGQLVKQGEKMAEDLQKAILDYQEKRQTSARLRLQKLSKNYRRIGRSCWLLNRR